LEHKNFDLSRNRLERRGALYTRFRWGHAHLHVLNVHLSLTHRQRLAQAQGIECIIGQLVPAQEPLILAGDFNDWRLRATQYLANELGLKEVFETHHGRPARSFPSMLPLFHLDRIYVRGLNVRMAHVHSGPTWHRLSDHAMLTATLQPA
jgi:endonuclease/exonuclease/phosphatase family metal-dependent hydrolase